MSPRLLLGPRVRQRLAHVGHHGRHVRVRRRLDAGPQVRLVGARRQRRQRLDRRRRPVDRLAIRPHEHVAERLQLDQSPAQAALTQLQQLLRRLAADLRRLARLVRLRHVALRIRVEPALDRRPGRRRERHPGAEQRLRDVRLALRVPHAGQRRRRVDAARRLQRQRLPVQRRPAAEHRDQPDHPRDPPPPRPRVARQRRQQLRHVGEAAVRQHAHPLEHDAPQPRRDLRAADLRDPPREHRRLQLRVRAPAERPLAVQPFKQRHTESELIRAPVEQLAAAEVDDPHPPVVADQHVVGLEVAVHDARAACAAARPSPAARNISTTLLPRATARG
jgi:hypothetical protein